MKVIGQEKGQALILIALAAVGLFGFTALAIDGSMYFSDRRHAQNAADTAALAASLARNRIQDPVAAAAALNTAAMDRAASNGYDNGATNDIIITTVDTPSGACTSTGKDITVTIISTINTTFARVLGRNQLTNKVSATARSCDITIQQHIPLYNGAAVMALNQDACNGRPTKNLYVGGSGQLQIWAAGMGSASADGGCVDFSGGNTQVEKQDPICPTGVTTAAASIPARNLNHLYNPDHCANFVVTGAGFAPPPDDLNIVCKRDAVKTNNYLSPGNWDTSVISPGSISVLEPGTYCITGEIHLTGGSLNGNGVTLVMLNGRFKMTGQSQMNIRAPLIEYDSNGNFTKGLLIYYPPGNSSDLTMEGESNGTLRGTVLAQSSNCFFAGSSQIQKAKLQFICDTFQINGNGQGELVWDSSVLFTPTTFDNPSVSLLK